MSERAATLRAAVWMIGSIICFSLLAVAGRELKGQLDTFEIMLYRSVLATFLTGGAALLLKRTHDLRPRHMPLQFVRNAAHFTAQNLWFYAVTVAPLAQVFALEFTMPIWALLLAVPVLGERLTSNRVATALAGFVGVLLVTHAWRLTIGDGILPAALAAIGFAVSAILTRRLTRTMPVLAILFWLSLMQAVFALVLAGYDGQIALPHGRALGLGGGDCRRRAGRASVADHGFVAGPGLGRDPDRFRAPAADFCGGLAVLQRGGRYLGLRRGRGDFWRELSEHPDRDPAEMTRGFV